MTRRQIPPTPSIPCGLEISAELPTPPKSCIPEPRFHVIDRHAEAADQPYSTNSLSTKDATSTARSPNTTCAHVIAVRPRPRVARQFERELYFRNRELE